MGWTAPRTWVAGELETAAIFNPHIRDNLLYLKGAAGAVQIDNSLTAVLAAGAELVAQGTNNGSFARFKLLTKRTSGTVVDWRILANGVSDAGELVFFDTTAAAERMRLDNAGFLGIGTAAPLGRIHVANVGAVAGAGFVVGSVAAVTSIQTVIAAGAVARCAGIIAIDRNNTSPFPTTTSVMQGFTLGANNQTYTNQDTITIAVTAGGAVTAQRTATGGTSGTHDIFLIVFPL